MIFNMTPKTVEEMKEGLGDQKVLLVLDVVVKFSRESGHSHRDGAEKDYYEIKKIFEDHFDCEIMPGKTPEEGTQDSNRHLLLTEISKFVDHCSHLRVFLL